VACLVASCLAVLVPILLFAWAWAIDPPGPAYPGGPPGGIYPTLVFVFGGPFVIAGLLGAIVSWKVLKKMTRTIAFDSSEHNTLQ
jgi:hypothetical protein